MSPQAKSGGAIALVSSGVAAAAALAACCALPILLAGIGLSATGFSRSSPPSGPYGVLLTCVSTLALVGSVVLVVRAGATCAPGDLCARPAFRVTIVAAAIVGAILLVLSQVYA